MQSYEETSSSSNNNNNNPTNAQPDEVLMEWSTRAHIETEQRSRLTDEIQDLIKSTAETAGHVAEAGNMRFNLECKAKENMTQMKGNNEEVER
jgi:hypothetical protein